MTPIKRRDFVSASALALSTLPAAFAAPGDLPKLPTDFGPCPRKLDDFLKYIVQRRAAEALNRVGSKPDGTLYGSGPEDANVAWVGAAAYRYPWSRFHRNEALRNRAFSLLDSIVRAHPDGKWDDGGLNAYFGPQSLGWAVLSWIETGDVDAPRAALWRDAVAKAADDGMLCLHYGPYRPSALTGQYANPEFYFLSGLAAAWKLTGDTRYRDEASKALRRYDDWLFSGGGMTYFLGSSPQHNYQHMIVKSTALHWDLTQDPHALEFLKRLAPYFPNVQHRSGLLTDAEQSHLKHSFFNPINPGAPAMLACILGDGANRHVADISASLMADSVDGRNPSFGSKGLAWYNYHAATFAVSALRLLERHPLPEAVPPSPRRVFVDASFRGVRTHWDDFTAAVGTRPMNDSLAGAYIADPREPLMPLDSALDGVYFEVLRGKSQFRCVEWSPVVTFASTEGFASTSCFTRLCAPYWGDMPFLPGEGSHPSEVADWSSLQHWATWRDCLIGFGALRCHASGGDAGDVARVRWRISPAGRKLDILEQSERSLRFRYGRLRGDLLSLDPAGSFSFKPADVGEAPMAAWTPLLVRSAPWSTGDAVNVATIIRPDGAEGSIATMSLTHGAAAVLLEPDARKAYVWVVNLGRHLQQYMLNLPPGVTVRTYKRDVEMPPVPRGEPANTGLQGAEGAVWVLTSNTALDVRTLIAGLRAGKSR